MRRIPILAALLLLAITPAWAQTSPNVVQGQVWTPGQWNSFLASKMDVGTACLLTGCTLTGPISAPTLTATATGTAISAPNGGISIGGALTVTNNASVGGTLTINTSPLRAGISTSPNLAPLFWGNGAGAAFPIGSADRYGSIGIGANALENLTGLGEEDVALGALACQMATAAGNLTCVGMHAGGAEATQSGDSLFGNDSGRDMISQAGLVTGLGVATFHDGNPGAGTVAIGAYALSGNASNILLGGTVTTGDVITVNLTATAGTYTLTGLPHSFVYTVAGGDTLSSIANAIATALNGAVADQNNLPLTVQVYPTPDGLEIIHFDYPGSASLGWDMTVAVTLSGGATETASVTGPSQATNTTVAGYNSLLGVGLGAVDSVTAYGANTLVADRTGGDIAVFGAGTGAAITTASGISAFGANNTIDQLQTGSSVDVLGSNVLHNATHLVDVVAIGDGAGFHATNLSTDLLLGVGAGATTLATGSADILICAGDQTCDVPTGSTSHYINVENIWTATGTNTPSTSVTTIAGVLNAVGVYQANGTAGVSCTGTPTSSFASIGGIVTHC